MDFTIKLLGLSGVNFPIIQKIVTVVSQVFSEWTFLHGLSSNATELSAQGLGVWVAAASDPGFREVLAGALPGGTREGARRGAGGSWGDGAPQIGEKKRWIMDW